MGQQFSEESDEGMTYSSRKFPNIPEDKKQFMQNWMKNLDNNEFICNITIPGTHNSLARYGGYLKITPMQCQSWQIMDQLESGIRFFDIRGKLDDGGVFEGYHEWIDQKIEVETVFYQLYDFLDRNKDEFIIINLQYELYDKKCHDTELTQCFEKLIEGSIKDKYWIIQKGIPTVGQARGKIFLINNWDYHGHMWKSCVKQNCWNEGAEVKRERIKKFCDSSNIAIRQQKSSYNKNVMIMNNQNNQSMKFYVNFLTSNTCFKWPLSFSKEMNKYYMEKCSGQGIIVMDFPGEKLLEQIIQSNFQKL